MIKTPYQHQTDPNKLPGQTVNPIKTLADYVEKVLIAEAPPPKKLSFDEWYQHRYTAVDFGHTVFTRAHHRKMKECWDAAQENK